MTPETSNGDATQPTHRSIAKDLMDYLRENPETCAEGNVHGWRWVKFCDGEWRATRYGGQHRLKGYAQGETLEPEDVLEWLTYNPIEIIPASEAKLWSLRGPTVWEDAEEQDAFKPNINRCFWCGQSERSTDLQLHETVEHGESHLCPGCTESWAKAGEIADQPTTADS